MTDTTSNASLFAAIAKVMADVRSLPKNGFNQQSRYNYVASDDALEAIGKAMAAHGVVVIPSMVGYESITDGKQTRTKAEFEMHVCCADGGAFMSRWFAEGIDYGNPDKALTKAITYATKTFLLKLFVVGAGDDDPDAESAPTDGQRKTQPQAQRNGTGQATTTHRNGATNGKPAPQPQAPADAVDDADRARKAFHAAGSQLFGDQWDAARPQVVEQYSTRKTPDNVRKSSSDLAPAELDEIAGTFTANANYWRNWLQDHMAVKA